MRLDKMKQNIVKHGKYNCPETELIYPSNICPECGHDITECDKKHYREYEIKTKRFFGTYYGAEVEFKCTECGCVFTRSIYTEYEPKEIDGMVATLIIVFLITLLLWTLYCITIPIRGKLCLTLLMLSIISTGFLIDLAVYIGEDIALPNH